MNTVSPGMTDTDMVAGRLEKAVEAIPMKRAGILLPVLRKPNATVADPSEIANVVAFAVSDKASYMAGANIRVGGGRP